MLKEKFQQLINKTGGNSKRKLENLVVFLIILVITCIAINYIWGNDTKKQSQNVVDSEKVLAKQEEVNMESENKNDMEEELENILSNINGVGNVKVLLTYSQTSTIVPMYDEDLVESNIEETDTEGGVRKTTETNSKKSIIYKESSGEKEPITQSVITPKVEGAIITAQGANNIDVKTNIVQAVEAVTGLATHKIQVFEMKNN